MDETACTNNNELKEDDSGSETETKSALLDTKSQKKSKFSKRKNTTSLTRVPSDDHKFASLQKKLEKQIEQAKKNNNSGKQGPNSALLPLKRVPIPNKKPLCKNEMILVWDSDSENEIRVEDNEINQQLLPVKNELIPEDEDLDLILPETFTRKCICCARNGTFCVIQ